MGVIRGAAAVLYGEPTRFLSAVQRLKQQLRKREKLMRLARQRVRTFLRKIRANETPASSW